MPRFSLNTQTLLTQAGWYPGRSVITWRQRLSLAVEGYCWFAAVSTFLQEFAGLSVSFPRQGSHDVVHFNARQAAAGIDASWVLHEYAKRLGNARLCVIGQAYSNHMVLFMDERGYVYGGYDEYLCLIAPSGPAAIEAILHEHSFEAIQELSDSLR